MKTELHLYDFDGTLFRSPLNSEENHAIYEKATGIPWVISHSMSKILSEKLGYCINPRSGWWGRPETLEPPLVPAPAPLDCFILETVQDFKKSQQDPNVLTVLLTGRFHGLKQHVLRICKDGNLFEIQKENELYIYDDKSILFYCLGESFAGSKTKNIPNSTLDWKIWMVEQILGQHPDIKQIKIWEDREEHIRHFRSLDEKWPQKISVTEVF